jgi:hypothetical protein
MSKGERGCSGRSRMLLIGSDRRSRFYLGSGMFLEQPLRLATEFKVSSG